MPVTPADVLQVARLARLRLDDDEVRRFTAELNAILGHIEALAEAAIGDATSGDGAPARAAPLRPDEPGADALVAPPEEVAPGWRDGFFVVPRLAALGADDAQDEAP